jgi:hypothetical protein
MELNGLHFTQAQLAELYTDKLVVTDVYLQSPPIKTEKKAIAPTANSSVNFKGKHKKGVLWLVHEPGQAFLSDEDFEFLSQIVAACKMNMEDIALVNLAGGTATADEAITQLQPKVILLCGIEHQMLPFKLSEYIIYPYNNCQYFLADRLEELRNDKVKKSKLWLALKAIFSL